MISYECSAGIAQIRMDDGKANVMSEAMLTDLLVAFDRAEAWPPTCGSGRRGRSSSG